MKDTKEEDLIEERRRWPIIMRRDITYHLLHKCHVFEGPVHNGIRHRNVANVTSHDRVGNVTYNKQISRM